LNIQEAPTLFFSVSCFPATHQQLFNDTFLKINKDLAYLQFELRACMNQYDGTVYYGVVNTIADEQSKLGTKYSVPQIAFYKRLVYACLLLLE
jgi:non-structural maintenance of chromosomes element 1